jgi:hypothetical protein
MSLDFRVTKRGMDFTLCTGTSFENLKNYEREFKCLTAFKQEAEDLFLIPRNKLVEVLDHCFDHFTEESLLSITKLLDKSDVEMKDRIVERSASKRNSVKKEKERVERVQFEEKKSIEDRLLMEREKWEREQREKREREQKEREQREREQWEKDRAQWEKEQREKLIEQERREQERIEQKEKRDRSSSERERKQRMLQDLNYSDPVYKVDILKMVASIRGQLDALEKYVNQL